MTKYVALLRGIGPGDPNKSNEALRKLFESLGVSHVSSFISSGNILFESEKGAKELESAAEKAFPTRLGYMCTTVIRSQQELQAIANAKPFKSLQHSAESYLMVTFFKNKPKTPFKFPYQPLGKPYLLKALVQDTLFSVTDNTSIPTTDLMSWLEKQFGKEITSRTWNTVQRILKKMDA